MDNLKDLFKSNHLGQTVLATLFIIYLIMGYDTPDFMNEMIDTTYGKIIVACLALLLFSYTNPILGIIGFFVAYTLIAKASISTGSYAVQHYMPTEKKKFSVMTKNNQYPYTLEQEIVKKMAPVNNYESKTTSYSFKPVLDELYNAAPIDYAGVV